MRPTRRSVLGGLSALALAPLLAACGGDGDGTSAGSPSGSTSGGTAEAVFPATVTHKYGTTTVTAAPQRVVCVGLTDQDTCLALGVVPVAITYWFGDEKLQGVYPWAEDAFGDATLPTVLKDTDGIQVEKIAALAPDLILAQYSGLQKADYDKLSQLAPVVAQSGDYADYSMPWDLMATNIGTALGQPAAVKTLVETVKKGIAAQAAAHPEFEGQTAAVVTPYEGLGIYGPKDPRSVILTELGFTLPEIVTSADESQFYITLSAERTTDLADLGVAVWLDLDDGAQVKKLFQTTRAYQQGRWFDISDEDGSYYVGQSFVTPLSIPWVLDRYVPQLAAAADGKVATKVPAVTA